MNISPYEQILMTCASEIQRYLIKTGANPADAQDIVQDVFIKLIQADIVLATDKLRPWFYRVALSRFYDLYRREKRYRALLSERFYLIYGNVGNSLKWKVENSWGEKVGKKGYFTASDAWMDEYTYQIVVRKEFLTAEELAAYEAEPEVLLPWDPMGALA